YQELDMTNQPAGVYFVELQAEGVKLMRKLVVQ
ncbi:MAG: T9SS type A sorting domain-containing protein, partial [Taibaiella sp.]|nr:T9SS type A sorting domain-containing protein [Taibaiella sp.]